MVPTGTNLLGLVKHVASVEAGYFGETFGRPFPEPLPWLEEGAEPNADMWATAEESREQIVGLYHRVSAHSDATIDALALDAVGEVPWWPRERREVTLHRILAHMIAETHRHAGHADIVRELIDGAVGLREGNDNMAPGDQAGGSATAIGWSAPRWRPARPSAPPASRGPSITALDLQGCSSPTPPGRARPRPTGQVSSSSRTTSASATGRRPWSAACRAASAHRGNAAPTAAACSSSTVAQVPSRAITTANATCTILREVVRQTRRMTSGSVEVPKVARARAKAARESSWNPAATAADGLVRGRPGRRSSPQMHTASSLRKTCKP